MHKGWLSRRSWLVVAALALLSLPGAARAESRVELILDASGSMWAKAGAEEKITAAKRVVKEWLKDAKLSADSRIGLTAYGHRAKDDCHDIERFPAVPYGQRGTLAPLVDKLSPKGKTPIADSLRTVGESLKSYEGAASILLVSDGIESCGQDPCAVAQQLREQYGVNVTIHVVGFDVGAGRPQLECIAREGGGKYFNAADAKELASAFEDVKTVLLKADTTPPARAAAKPKEAEPPAQPEVVTITRVSAGTLEIRNFDNSGIVQILDQQTGEKRAQYCNGCTTAQVAAGTYKVTFPNFAQENVVVKAGQRVVLDLGE
jgi:Ca-activated chloride channel homolog